MDLSLIRRLSIPAETKVLLCVMDGLGGLPGPRGRTELEEASSRHLDRLAEQLLHHKDRFCVCNVCKLWRIDEVTDCVHTIN